MLKSESQNQESLNVIIIFKLWCKPDLQLFRFKFQIPFEILKSESQNQESFILILIFKRCHFLSRIQNTKKFEILNITTILARKIISRRPTS